LEIKKGIPNALTLCNLLCGCAGIIEILQNYSITGACIFMSIALVCDFLDGFLARLLKVSSPIGKELDSLADVVTFGILPTLMLWSIMQEYAKMPMELAYMAFFVACASALRLAKFNIDTRQNDSFIGVPTPANAILIASISYNLEQSSNDLISECFQNIPFAIIFTLVSSYLLIAELPLFAFKFKSFGWKGNEIRYSFLAFALLLIQLLKFVAIPWIIISYVILSVILFVRNKIGKNS
jgi:CDP-diacylglycerol---serine O-phosphatidyltransferase